jgi:DAACS family dicarboxylate/amino acid:cation (Na+ or H+) symporter
LAGFLANAVVPPGAQGEPNATLQWFSHNVAGTLGQIFLRLIFMVVVPLVFSALVLAVAAIGGVRRLGKLGLWALGLTLLMSSISVIIGLTLSNVVRPGEHLSATQQAELRERYAAGAQTTVAQAREAKSLRDTLLDILPRNPLQEMVNALEASASGGGMLAVMFFALVVGMAITAAPERTGTLVSVLEGIFDITMVVIHFAMRLAPVGVAGLMFALAATLGLDVLEILLWFVITVLSGLALHLIVVYSAVLIFFGRMAPWRFFARVSEAMLTAFATSSSSATLPTALAVSDEKLHLHKEIARFVLTVGATANQNGTALYEGVTVLFLAQVFGVDLTLTQQVNVVLFSILAGIGTAGVPGGSLPMIVLLLNSLGIPGEGIGIILGVDRLLDMCRTTLNVTGDLVIAVCVNRYGSRG